MRILGSIGLVVLVTAAAAGGADSSIPHLRRQGTATQLIVDGKPFLIRGGELGNSTASNPAYLERFWTRFAELNMNTVLAPVYWDLIEPDEGRFDFSTLDRLIEQASANRMRLVLLWFASWKNSMSCYAPGWVKRDPQRFPRATDLEGVRQEILSPFSAENRDADARAFAAVQKHLRDFDGAAHTVVMVQVENEIGMIPTARDHSGGAERAFGAAVPTELLAYLAAHKEELAPELRAIWRSAGGKPGGTWTEVFGSGPAGEEIFMAWHVARYALVAQLEPLIVGLQGRGKTAGLLSEGPEQRQPQQVRLGGYVLAATFERGTPPSLADGVLLPTASAAAPPPSGGLVLSTAPDEFIVAGTAVTITFASSVAGKRAGILSAEEGRLVAGRFENVRWLNGDETHQGRHVRLEPGRFSLQRVRLYLY